MRRQHEQAIPRSLSMLSLYLTDSLTHSLTLCVCVYMHTIEVVTNCDLFYTKEARVVAAAEAAAPPYTSLFPS